MIKRMTAELEVAGTTREITLADGILSITGADLGLFSQVVDALDALDPNKQRPVGQEKPIVRALDPDTAATRADNIAAKSKALMEELGQQTEAAPVPTEGRSKLRTVPKPPATKEEPPAEKAVKQRDIKPAKSEPAEAAVALDLENPPEEIVQASRLADVIHALRKMGWTGIDAVVSACTSLRDRGNVPILKVASDLEARVRSTYEHLFPAAKDSA